MKIENCNFKTFNYRANLCDRKKHPLLWLDSCDLQKIILVISHSTYFKNTFYVVEDGRKDDTLSFLCFQLS